MDLLQAIVLGIIQGIAEWLPISSEGMISLFMVEFMGATLQEAINYAIFLHIGTLLAALVYLRKDVLVLLKHIPRYKLRGNTKNDSELNFLFIATAFTGLVGGVMYIIIHTYFPELDGALATAVIGAALLITGFMQLTIKSSTKHKQVSLKDTVITGIAQGFAIVPGISRSGTTVAALLLLKHQSTQALRLSFLLSIPAVLIAQIAVALFDPISLDVYSLIALFTAFVSGLATIHILMKVAVKINFGYFCIVLGIVSIGALFI